jgi:hypothetical protein
MKNDLTAHEKALEDVSQNLPNMAPHSAPRFDREAESHPGELETLDTVANSPDTFHHVLCAVQECQAKPPANFQRIVLVLAPADRARSHLAAAVAKRAGASVMTPASLRVTVGRRCPAAQIMGKSAALPYLSEGSAVPASVRRPVLVIDQGESFSREQLDFLKLLINLTPVVLVLLATVAAYYRWRQSWPVEARQIHRRTHLVLERREERKWL